MNETLDPWKAVEAIATCLLVLVTVCIPVALAIYAVRLDRTREKRQNADEASRVNREVFGQWQAYNLAVASGDIVLHALPDEAFQCLDHKQLKQLHIIFFKLTLLYQLWLAHGDSLNEDPQAEAMIKQLAPNCQEDYALYQIATKDRGYSQEFLEVMKRHRTVVLQTTVNLVPVPALAGTSQVP